MKTLCRFGYVIGWALLIAGLSPAASGMQVHQAPDNPLMQLPSAQRNPVAKNPAAMLQRLSPTASVTPEMLQKWPCISTYHHAIDITCYGAVGDGGRASDAQMSNGGNVITSARAGFQAGDAGKTVVIDQAGPQGGFLEAKILNVQSPQQIVISATSSHDVRNANLYWGTDSTQSFDYAVEAAKAEKIPLYIPAGVYFYNGPGFQGWLSPRIYGEGRSASVVLLGPKSYFLDDPGNWSLLNVHDLSFFGGIGAIRSRYQSAVEYSEYMVENTNFENFTGTAISNNSVNNPYWSIRKCIFNGENTTTSVGVALAGGNDTTSITDNSFINYRIGIKLAHGGANVHVSRNEFLQFTQADPGGPPRVAIWITPSPSPNLSGFVAAWNKFGNENIGPADLRVLYANEGSGEYFGDRMPSAELASGFECGQTFVNNAVMGGGSTATPFVYSYTPNICSGIYASFQSGGTPMGYVLEFAPSLLPLQESSANTGNICGPVLLGNLTASIARPIGGSNALDTCEVVDPVGDASLLQYNDPSPWPTGTGVAGFTNLLTAPLTAFSRPLGVAITPISDSTGAPNAIRLNITPGRQIAETLSAGIAAGEPVWADFELKSESANSPRYIAVAFLSRGHQWPLWHRLVEVPPQLVGWKRIRVRFVPREALAPGEASFAIGISPASTAGTLDIGHVSVYQSWEPVSGGEHLDTVNVDDGMICLKRDYCIQANSGPPSGACRAGIYFRTDDNSVYVCQKAVWKLQ